MDIRDIKKRTKDRRSGQYLTGTDLAEVCQVDLKSIHNWIVPHHVPHFRTPGGHFRFRPREIVPWLEKHGYDIPTALRAAAIADASANGAAPTDSPTLPVAAALDAHHGAVYPPPSPAAPPPARPVAPAVDA